MYIIPTQDSVVPFKTLDLRTPASTLPPATGRSSLFEPIINNQEVPIVLRDIKDTPARTVKLALAKPSRLAKPVAQT